MLSGSPIAGCSREAMARRQNRLEMIVTSARRSPTSSEPGQNMRELVRLLALLAVVGGCATCVDPAAVPKSVFVPAGALTARWRRRRRLNHQGRGSVRGIRDSRNDDMLRKLPLTICCLVSVVATVDAGHTLTSRQSGVMASWLTAHSGFRVATAADCACAEDIAQMRKGFGGRWKPVRDYAPYVATGDFNGDGQSDFAVVVVDISRPREHLFILMVFNGPSQSAVKPHFTQRDLDMRGKGLFFGAPRPRPHRLVVGAFESEGAILQPVGSSYRLAYE